MRAMRLLEIIKGDQGARLFEDAELRYVDKPTELIQGVIL